MNYTRASTAYGPKTLDPRVAPMDTGPIPRPGGLPPMLSIEQLMAWVASTVTETDVQLRSQMQQMVETKDTQGAISNMLQQLHKIHLTTGEKCTLTPDPSKSDDYKKLDPKSREIIDRLMSRENGAEGGKEVVRDFDATPINASISDDSKDSLLVKVGAAHVDDEGNLHIHASPVVVKKDSVDEAMKALDGQLSAAQSGNELQMMKLSSAVSARGQMIQLVSNMIHQMEETTKTIVGNTR